MVTVPVVDGFTQDVITLLTLSKSGGVPRSLRAMVREIPAEERPEFLRNGLVQVLGPFMALNPPFVQSLVARVIMEKVDWDTVVERFVTEAECN
jgi:hypothetical protein